MNGGARTSPLLFLGLFLFGASAVLSSILGSETYLPRLLLVAGVVATVVGLRRSAGALRFLLFRARSVAEPGPAVLWLLTGAIGMVLAFGLGLREARVDLTSRGLNRLSETSREALSTISGEITLVAVVRETSPLRDRMEELLSLYRGASSRIRTRLLDPDREPEAARELGVVRTDVVLVTSGSTQTEVTALEEADLTQAILRVEDPTRPEVAVLEGHGETAEGRARLDQLRELLARAGVEYATLRSSEHVEVPPTVRVVLLAGARSPLLPGEVEALARFLERGGRAAIWIEPGTVTGLEPFLLDHGIAVDGRTITDAGAVTKSVGLGPETIGIHRFGDHPVTRGLSVGVVLPGATRVGVAPRAVFGLETMELLRTGGQARLGDDPEAVHPVAAAVQWEVAAGALPASRDRPHEKGYARLVVVGDSDFARDSGLSLYGNREFTARIFGWLAERSYLLRFPPADRSGTPLRAGLGGLRTIAYIVQLALPLGLFLFAYRAWSRRR